MCQSNSIARYLAKQYKGLQGETLYPANTDPRLMHKIDEILEIATEFLHSYVGFIAPFFPSFKERDTLLPKWLKETLPKYLEKLAEYTTRDTAYLCGNEMTVADIVMFSHFWKLAIN